MSVRVIVGWISALIGTALWLYGYLVVSSSLSFINWHAITPWWIADFLPNRESEIGMAIVLASMIPIYWPVRH